MTILFMSELGHYMSRTRTDRVVVDPTVGEKLGIHFNITFFSLSCAGAPACVCSRARVHRSPHPLRPCADVNLDTMDVTGEQQLHIDHSVFKERLGPDGQRIGTAFKEDITEQREQEQLPPNYCGSCFGARPAGEVRHHVRARAWKARL